MKVTERFHHTLMYITLACMLAAAAIVPFANINSDMTKYLPDGSRMKQALDIVNAEFEAGDYIGSPIKVMAHDLSNETADSLNNYLSRLSDVEGVTRKVSADGKYVLYQLQVPDSVDMASLARTIKYSCDEDLVIETKQDGATPPLIVIVIAAVLIIVILLIMCQSWLEPFVFLVGVGVAVVINIGTNSLLPSVSITTNYIGAILQLVLSLDFSIVMMNRFRQEMSPERTSLQSMNRAIKRAARPVLSSALTTIVGLLMLCFMRLKIGMDMGVVLAKGVVCSLICTFTLLPSLLMIFRKAIEKTAKKSFVLPTDKLGRFATGHKVSVAILGVLILGTSWYFSRQTKIFFSTKGKSEINNVFPSPNPFVVVYDNDDAQNIIALADTLEHDSCVQMIVSYPTLLQIPFTAEEEVDYLSLLSRCFADQMPPSANMDMLTNETMSIVYYMRQAKPDTIRATFMDIMQFVADECVDNPLFSGFIDDDMRAQIDLLQQILNPIEEPEAEVVKVQPPLKPEPTTTKPTIVIDSIDTPFKVYHPTIENVEKQEGKVEEQPAEVKEPEEISLIAFVKKYAAKYPSEEANYLLRITDTVQLRTPLRSQEMSEFIGSTRSQTNMVYSFYKGKTISPYNYVRFLLDDLFNRKALKSFVNDEQKKELKLVEKFMKSALHNEVLTYSQISSMLVQRGLTDMTVAKVRAIAIPTSVQQIETNLAIDKQTENNVVESSTDVKVATTTQPIVAEPIVKKVKPKKSAAEKRADYFFEQMNSKKALNSREMAAVFNRLGQRIKPTEAELLYMFYGYKHYYDSTYTMSTEQLLNFVVDTLVVDERLKPFFPAEMSTSIVNARQSIAEPMAKLCNDKHGLFVVLTNLPDETDETYAFVERLDSLGNSLLKNDFYMLGEGVMYEEMRQGFHREMLIVTILTILAIFLIVAFSFRSVVIPCILITTVLSAVWVNVIFAGIVSKGMLYLAYLIVQSILMGATIDYGILFTNYYKEFRKVMTKYPACFAAYKGSIRTIITSGMIMVVAPGAMALLVDDVAISSIVGCLAIGAFVAIVLILVVLPAVLVALDRWVVLRKETYEFLSKGDTK